jgi:hypothetical protein
MKRLARFLGALTLLALPAALEAQVPEWDRDG